MVKNHRFFKCTYVIYAIVYCSAHTNTAYGATANFLYNNPPAWEIAMNKRAQELQELQSNNDSMTAPPHKKVNTPSTTSGQQKSNNKLQPATFPATIKDIAFYMRVDNATAGYKIFDGAPVYVPISISILNAVEARMAADIANGAVAPAVATDIANDDAPQEPATYVANDEIAQDSATENSDYYNDYSPQNTTSSSTATNNMDTNSAVAANYHPTNSTTAQPAPANGGTTFDNRTHNGPCTPSSYSPKKGRVDKILTSGKYETIDPAFEKAMVQIFRLEGGCPFERRNGKCVPTTKATSCYGYEQPWWGNKIDFCSFTRPKAEDQTYTSFYKQYKIDTLPDSVRGDVLRGDFHFGSTQGIKILQQALGLKLTGKITTDVVRAAENYNGDLHNRFWDYYSIYMTVAINKHPDWAQYRAGWEYGILLFRENGCHVAPKRPLTR